MADNGTWIEVKKYPDKLWYWTLVTGVREILYDSNGFKTEQEARDDFNKVRHAFMCVMA